MKKSLIAIGFIAVATLPWVAYSKEYTVEMKFDEDSGEVYFSPNRLEVKSGDTVVFMHNDSYNMHNIMFEPASIPSGAKIPMMSPDELKQGDLWKVTFNTSGSYKYHCHSHYDMGMAGEIIVDHPSKPVDMNMDTSMGNSQSEHHMHNANSHH